MKYRVGEILIRKQSLDIWGGNVVLLLIVKEYKDTYVVQNYACRAVSKPSGTLEFDNIAYPESTVDKYYRRMTKLEKLLFTDI